MARLNLKAHPMMMMKIEMQLKRGDWGPFNGTVGGCDA